MVQLLMILLGVDYLRDRWRGLMLVGFIGLLSGSIVFIDALDNIIYIPLYPFAFMLLVEGLATLLVAHTGIGGQKNLRYTKGGIFSLAAVLILSGQHHGNFILSMIFGTLFFIDGLLQSISASVVRYKKWNLVIIGGVFEIIVAIFFFQPYPTYYAGTVSYCLAMGLIFGGWNMVMLSVRVKTLKINPVFFNEKESNNNGSSVNEITPSPLEFNGPISVDEPSLIIHIWTPTGSAKGTIVPHPIIDRYIAAVDKNGIISTGHAALESPEGIYISLYPSIDIDRSPDQFSRLLRATEDNDVEGIFQPNYITESEKWCHSTTQVRIKNYDAKKLNNFWEIYKKNNTYNLTHRNCSSSVTKGLEAAIEGIVGKIWKERSHWWVISKIIMTPELWVAIQIRKRAQTMAWTPGLTLDYARALSMIADPRPTGWIATIRQTIRKISYLRKKWNKEDNKIKE